MKKVFWSKLSRGSSLSHYGRLMLDMALQSGGNMATNLGAGNFYGIAQLCREYSNRVTLYYQL